MNAILFNLFLIVLIVYFIKKIRRSLHMLQLEHYQLAGYYKWLKNHYNIAFKWTEIVVFIFLIIMYFINSNACFILGIVIFVFLSLSIKHVKEKKPFVVTSRVKRIYGTIIFISIIFLAIANLNHLVGLILFFIYVFMAYYMTMVFVIINSPIEKSIQRHFINMAAYKLKSNKNLKVIGITGSYGKTSTKYILTTILESKYNCLMTPESFNTPMGVVKTINEKLKSEHEIFVCEMGARHVGDIQEICDIVSPDMGILTSVGPQHLDTFKSIDNVLNTKMELINSLSDEGLAFINGDDENIKNAKMHQNTIKYGLSKNNDYYAKNIAINEEYEEFDVYHKDELIMHAKTKLLGKNNIINILAGVAVAYTLGVSSSDIALSIRKLKPVPHRLELTNTGNGTLIIDDAFNSNVSGSKDALEVLSSFKKRMRILITPGMVELGDKEYDYNKELGCVASASADYVILLGKNSQAILDGLKEKEYNENNVYVASSLEDATKKMKEIIKGEAVVLFENDLTDNYL